jgi:2-furoyl-CoA dehydrogenase large subunit
VVADVLGLDFGAITVNVELDTQKDPWSNASGNYSSRFAGAVAGTVYEAANRIRKRVAAIAAHQFEVDADRIRFAGGQVTVAGDDRHSASFRRMAGTAHWAPALLPDNEAGGLRETAFWSPPQLEAPDAGDHINSSLCYGFVFDYCGVEIDAVSGRVRLDRYVTLHDAGKILNPAVLDGQVRGGFAQGLGAALMEKFEYGADGSFQAGTLADYLIPTTMEVPEPVILHMETPSPFTPLGAKGAGEGNNMSTPVCIANAVADALGEREIELPLTPSRVRSLIGIDEPAAPEGLEPVKPAAGSGSALQASDSVEMPGDPETVFNAMLDPEILAKIIPGCHDLQAVGDNAYQADVTVGVGMIRARYKADVNLSELDPPNALKLGGVGRSAMGTAEGSARVRLTAIEGQRTRLDYEYEAAIGGKFAAVGARMLQGAARVIIGQIFSRLAAELGGGSSAGAWWRRVVDMILSLFGRSKK